MPVLGFFQGQGTRERNHSGFCGGPYAGNLAWPKARSAPTAPRLMMRPKRPRRMYGSAARLMYGTVIKFEEKMFCQSSMEDSAKRAPAKITDIIHHDINASEALSDSTQELFGARSVGDIGLDSDAIGAAGLQL